MQQSIRNRLAELREDPRRFRALHGQLQRRVRMNAGRYRPYVDDDMITNACHDAIMSTMVQFRGDFEAATSDASTFEDALLGYLFGAARFNLLRALDRDPRAHEVFFESDGGVANPIDAAMASAPPSPWLPEDSAAPDANVLARQRHTILNDCLAQLTELARRTFELALRGLTDQEIQRELDVASAVTVRRRVHDTKLKLMECVQGKDPGRSEP